MYATLISCSAGSLQQHLLESADRTLMDTTRPWRPLTRGTPSWRKERAASTVPDPPFSEEWPPTPRAVRVAHQSDSRPDMRRIAF